MTADDDLLAAQKMREQMEADLVKNRIEELREKPIRGNFDAEHLKAVHAYIFQDLPHHKPGLVRSDVEGDRWVKYRGLEGSSGLYTVDYVIRGVEPEITGILDRFGGRKSIEGLSADDVAAALAQLYGDLDHAHGFHEGNSRTLREFTRELALEGGFELDWVGTGVGKKERDELYIARDIAVLERAYPGLTAEKAMQTDDRAEYEAFNILNGLRQKAGDRHLAAIIREGISPARRRGGAQDDPTPLSPEEILSRYGSVAPRLSQLASSQAASSDRPMTGDEISADPVRHAKQRAQERARMPDAATPETASPGKQPSASPDSREQAKASDLTRKQQMQIALQRYTKDGDRANARENDGGNAGGRTKGK